MIFQFCQPLVLSVNRFLYYFILDDYTYIIKNIFTDEPFRGWSHKDEIDG